MKLKIKQITNFLARKKGKHKEKVEVIIIDSDPIIASRIKNALHNTKVNCLGIFSDLETAEIVIDSSKPKYIILNMAINGQLNGFQIAKIIELEYNVLLILVGDVKNLKLSTWASEIKTCGFVLLNYSDDELKQKLKELMS
jgi:PleD family two-component response regulator